jgi:hypothetical protein
MFEEEELAPDLFIESNRSKPAPLECVVKTTDCQEVLEKLICQRQQINSDNPSEGNGLR